MTKRTKKLDPRATTNVDTEIGSRIRSRRLETSMSQERLAAAIGVTFQQVQKYEKGVNRVSASTLIEIAKALEVSAATLLPSQQRNGSAELAIDAKGFTELATTFAQLNEAGRKMLVQHARTVVAEPSLRRTSDD